MDIEEIQSGRKLSNDLNKIKQIAEQMPDSPEKQQAMQAYSNLKLFETIADCFERVVDE